jgi:glutamate/aspartate transport system substrate-binding protein
MTKASLVSCAALAALWLSAPAFAHDLTGILAKIMDSGSITIGYRETSMPFSYIDDNQKPLGSRWISVTRSSTR